MFRVRLTLEPIVPPLRLLIAALMESALKFPPVVTEMFPPVPIWPAGLVISRSSQRADLAAPEWKRCRSR